MLCHASATRPHFHGSTCSPNGSTCSPNVSTCSRNGGTCSRSHLGAERQRKVVPVSGVSLMSFPPGRHLSSKTSGYFARKFASFPCFVRISDIRRCHSSGPTCRLPHLNDTPTTCPRKSVRGEHHTHNPCHFVRNKKTKPPQHPY